MVHAKGTKFFINSQKIPIEMGQNSLYKVGILLLIILLGLTAVFPEWLELKDIIISQHRNEKISEPNTALVSTETINNVRSIPRRILSSINNRIIGTISPVDFAGAGPAAIIFYALWLLLALVMYVSFFTLCLLIFLFTGDFVRKKFNTSIIFLKKHPKIIPIIRLGLSICLAAIIWPALIDIIIMIFKLL